MSASSEKRCLYEVLGGLNRECTPDEIRSAYRKLALQRHPDKLVKSGVSEAEATAQFQELVNAYEVLSDPRERAWYDSHRSQILFSNNNNNNSASGSSSGLPDLFSFFSNSVYNGYGDTGKGFFKVYGQVFDDIYMNEVNFAKKLGLGFPNEAPLLGNLESPYVQVTAFYNYWLGFMTMMDFCWVDQYDAMAGMNRKSRRMMEDENKKLRKKAKRDYNDTVRGLAEFVKKRDKRVIDMQVKRKEEIEKKKEVERERKKELERQKAEKAMKYEEPEWAKVEEEEEEFEESLEEEEDEKKNELYCVVCGKKFKSDKQWKNHEQSKKHKEKVAELRRAFRKEDKANFDGGEGEEDEEDGSGYLPEDNGVNGVTDKFEDHKINDSETQSSHDDNDENDDGDNDENDDEDDIELLNGSGELGAKLGSGDDEASILEAMISGRKKNLGSKNKPKASAQQVKVDVDDDDDEMDFMEYNNIKDTRRNRGGRRRKGRKQDEEAVSADVTKTNNQAEENNTHEDGSHVQAKVNVDVDDDDEMEFMEYNNIKDTRRNRGGRRRKGRKPDEEAVPADVTETDNQAGENNTHEDGSHVQASPSHSLLESESEADVKGNGPLEKRDKLPKQIVDKKGASRKENTKLKNAKKGKKQKATSTKVNARMQKESGNECEKCGEEFESRNKLHKHLEDTGHAALKR